MRCELLLRSLLLLLLLLLLIMLLLFLLTMLFSLLLLLLLLLFARALVNPVALVSANPVALAPVARVPVNPFFVFFLFICSISTVCAHQTDPDARHCVLHRSALQRRLPIEPRTPRGQRGVLARHGRAGHRGGMDGGPGERAGR